MGTPQSKVNICLPSRRSWRKGGHSLKLLQRTTMGLNVMQRYNRTNFTSAAFAERLIAAMRGALSDGFAHYVENRHGQRWLRVDVKPDDFGGYTFQFLAGSGQDVGSLILQACFVWSEAHERAFSGLLSELYTRSEHPLLTARRRDAEAEAESNSNKAKKPWKSALKHALGYLTAIAVGGGLGHAYVALAHVHLPGLLP